MIYELWILTKFLRSNDDVGLRVCTIDVTPQTQKGPKHEKHNPKAPIDFSLLTIQSK